MFSIAFRALFPKFDVNNGTIIYQKYLVDIKIAKLNEEKKLKILIIFEDKLKNFTFRIKIRINLRINL